METVHTVWEFYDGPRTGIADYNGKPHYFCCKWDAELGDFSEAYSLFLIDAETLQLALAQWGIWREWEFAFHSGKVPASTHPGHGGNERYNELECLLQTRIKALVAPQARVLARFHPVQGGEVTPVGVMRPFLVEWANAA